MGVTTVAGNVALAKAALATRSQFAVLAENISPATFVPDGSAETGAVGVTSGASKLVLGDVPICWRPPSSVCRPFHVQVWFDPDSVPPDGSGTVGLLTQRELQPLLAMVLFLFRGETFAPTHENGLGDGHCDVIIPEREGLSCRCVLQNC